MVMIKELEAILEDPIEGMIEIQPDGSVEWVEGKAHHAKPKIITLNEALDSTY